MLAAALGNATSVTPAYADTIVFTSADNTTFTIGSFGLFDITTVSSPRVTSITLSGALPGGVTFSDNADGSASLSGAPDPGTDGTYPLTFTASNGVDPDIEQNFTLTIDEPPSSTPPAITSQDNTAFILGVFGTFTVTTTGVPTVSTITAVDTPTLPASVTFVDNGDGTATLSGTPLAIDEGVYTLQISADNGLEPATQTFTLTIGPATPPAITSADNATFIIGNAGTFTVTTTGIPTITSIGATGSLPSGVTFIDNGDGTATLAGTPAVGTAGIYPLTITASNGVGTDAVQSFNLTVNQYPTITSANNTAFTLGIAGTFTVTTSGVPAVSSITAVDTPTLPASVTFVDNGDGTATLSGTPLAGDEGIYTLEISADNGVGESATQTFTLTIGVATPPAITSADTANFIVGAAGSFTVTTTGIPAVASIGASGILPGGVTFTNNGDGTATLSGTPTAGSGGTYPLTITATNGIAPNANQSFILTVSEDPVITSADNTTFFVGNAGTFTVMTIGFPVVSTITAVSTPALPGSVAFVDNGDGTATLSGTPLAGDEGVYILEVTASNGIRSSSQTFTLTIEDLDLTVSKTNNISGSVVFPNSWQWTIRLTNDGPGTVTFADGDLMFTDNMPDSNLSYSLVGGGGYGGTTGIVDATNGPNVFWTASGTVTMPPGSYFEVIYEATPSAAGTFVNPRAGGICRADPDGLIAESNEGNNDCSDTVTVVAPTVEVSPTSHDFGNQAVGTTSSAFTFTVTNIGTADLTIGTLSVTGQFALTNNQCDGDVLAPNASCNFSATFHPTSTGAKTGEVSIPSDAASSPDSVALSGNGTDNTAPNTTILTHPASSTAATSATFTFKGSDNLTPAGSLTFQCKLDGGAFGACSSPKNYANLAIGTHTFKVRAKDQAGNVDPTPASFTWTILAPQSIKITNGSCYAGSLAKGKFALRAIDPEDDALSLTVVSSSNLTLVPKANVLIISAFNVFSVVIEGAPGQIGSSVITLKLSDGATSKKFTINFMVGSNQRDVLRGSNGIDMLFGMGGNDALRGLGASDLLCGGTGNDSLTGGLGGDFFSGGPGTDTATDFNAAQGDKKDNTIP